MAYRFPSTISAARVVTFVSTAAWIQGTSASEAALPEEALNNFLRRHGVGAATKVGPRQASASAPVVAAPKDEDDEEEKEEADSVSSASSVSGDGVEEDGASSASSADSTPSKAAAAAADSDPAQTTGSSTSSNPAVSGSNTNSNGNSAQAGITAASSGQPAIGSADPPALSTGAKVAIGVWSAVAVVALAGLIYFFSRRRRARMAMEEMNALRDEEFERERSQRGMSEAGGFAGGGAGGPPISAVAPSVYLRDSRGGGGAGGVGVGAGVGVAMGGGMGGEIGGMGGTSRAPSGQWMATPPWQDSAPTWRDSHPWRQSQPSVVGAQDRFPAGSRPPLPPFAPQNTKPEDDRRTEYTAETESTIFAYR
ncbi:uncharacterized protein F4807DRAFT_153993 [Annulohypoxylon truncatum]|uniref:uncharacterized protein n=1 Tax=Annulohypoxylon truncatum TaxID=327061 RepID=UPI002007903B|nr:uncharacterized protein F4807DRAFT_153993 [Annulohypoxylon truncatum]KAI1208124.1 hypothetical protein F4807DRAFT_153993 [Annulohypoxylon truncatum]